MWERSQDNSAAEENVLSCGWAMMARATGPENIPGSGICITCKDSIPGLAAYLGY